MYNEAFSGDGRTSSFPSSARTWSTAWHLYVLRLRPDALRIDRSGFIEELKRRTSGLPVHFIPIHLHPYTGTSMATP